jgi:hypothetical protein
MNTTGRISATDAVSDALEWARVVCFRPFALAKWLVLGFCAFLASLGQGGGGCSPQVRMPWRPWSGAPPQLPNAQIQQGLDWAGAHAALLVGLVLVGFALMVVLSALLLWLSSRGKFMLLDGVVHDRGQVVEPWKRLRPFGNSLFVFEFCVAMVAMVLMLTVLLAGGLIALSDIRARQFGGGAVLALIVVVVCAIPLSIGFALLRSALNDFVVPIMYRRGLRAPDAVRVFAVELLRGRVGPFIVFYLLKIAVAIGAGIAVGVATCLMCCIPVIPYVGSVIFLPVAVFFRSYSLYFLGQFGEEWRLLPNPHLPRGAVTLQAAPSPDGGGPPAPP